MPLRMICNQRELTFSEPEWKILTLGVDYAHELPPPGATVTFIDETGQILGTGTVQKKVAGRIDGLGWWYNQHPNIREGNFISVHKDDDTGRYMIKLENNIGAPLPMPVPNEAESGSSFVEKDLENATCRNLSALEDGLNLVGQQYTINNTDVQGKIDILATDKNNKYVVIELKRGNATDQVCCQVLKYITLVKQKFSVSEVRGIIIASEFDSGLKLAVANLPYISLKKYNINLSFENAQETNSQFGGPHT